jgi:hypothetical protein
VNRHLKFVLPVALFSSAVFAQQQSGSLSGRVLDSSGAVIPGAQITITDPSRGIQEHAIANASGEYAIPLLPPDDHYILTVTAGGFGTITQKNVSLQVAQAATINVTLTAGSVTETVDVDAQLPLLDTRSSALGQVITGQTVQDLPLNGRSTFRLIALTPGVVFSNGAYGQFGDTPVNTTFDSNFRINGGRASSNEFLIDGVPTAVGFFNQITTDPMPDETQEFKVESSNLSAQYGRFAGGVINVSTKSGTNQIHGDVFDFIRNSVFDSNDWFNKQAGKARPLFRMNQFGGVVGGPLVLPKLYNGRDKTFFFASYQGTRRAKGSPYSTCVPTDAMRAGDFSGTLPCNLGSPTIYNPFSYNATTGARNEFATHNKIDPSLIDPVAANILKYYPEPNANVAGASYNYVSSAPIVVNEDTWSGRIDQQVTSKWRTFGRYSVMTTGLTQPNQYGNIADSAGSVGTTHFRNQSLAFSNTYTLNANNLISVTYGFARWHQIRTTLSYGFNDATLGLPSSVVNAIQIPMFPAVNITSFGSFGGQSYFNNGNDAHALLAQWTHVSGRSTLNVGVDGRLHRINFYNNANPAGVYNFTQQFTRSNNVVTTGGNAFASFLLGTGGSGSITVAGGSELQDLYGAVYAQEDLRITSRLTLNLGVRYDGESPFEDRHNALNYFDSSVASPARNPSFPNLTGGLVFANTNSTGRSVYTREHGNVAPRIGFAFAATPTTSVRGGYAIVYSPLELTNNGVGTVPNLGYSSTTNWNPSIASGNGATAVDLLRNPYPNSLVQPTGKTLGAATQLGQSLTVWTEHPATPYNQQYSLNVQQQFPGNALLDVAYIGSHAVHLTSPREFDYLPYSTLQAYGSAINTQVTNPFASVVSIGTLAQSKVAQRQLLLPFPQFTSVMEVNNTWGSSSYNSATVKFVKRASHDVTLLLSYTWSKSISDVNAQTAPIGNTNQSTTPQDWGNLRAERSVSEMDLPNNFVASLNAALPFGKGQAFLSHGGLLNQMVGGWSANGIFTAQDGFPLTLSLGSTSWGATRVNRVPGVSPIIPGKRSNIDRVKAWYNVKAFTTPAAYTYGTERRTTTDIRKPGIANLDMSLVKRNQINDRLSTEFRAEVFDLSNTPHFAPPNMVLDSANPGTITSVLTGPPGREMQFAFKLNF